MANKTDKELAVDVAIAYIQASGNRKVANGASAALVSLENVQTVIDAVHRTLKSLND
jgi:hypothetical protein